MATKRKTAKPAVRKITHKKTKHAESTNFWKIIFVGALAGLLVGAGFNYSMSNTNTADAAGQVDLYVSQDGNDANSGISMEKPLQSITKAIQKANAYKSFVSIHINRLWVAKDPWVKARDTDKDNRYGATYPLYVNQTITNKYGVSMKGDYCRSGLGVVPNDDPTCVHGGVEIVAMPVFPPRTSPLKITVNGSASNVTFEWVNTENIIFSVARNAYQVTFSHMDIALYSTPSNLSPITALGTPTSPIVILTVANVRMDAQMLTKGTGNPFVFFNTASVYSGMFSGNTFHITGNTGEPMVDYAIGIKGLGSKGITADNNKMELGWPKIKNYRKYLWEQCEDVTAPDDESSF